MTWQAATKALVQAGGGPVTAVTFWPPSPTGTDRSKCLRRARQLGLMTLRHDKYRWVWTITQLGRDWDAGIAPDPSQQAAPQIDREALIKRLTFGVDDALATVKKLTGRQQEVMVLVACGLTTKEIAEQLGMGSTTIDRHRSKMMVALGCERPTEVAVLAAKAGLI